MSFKLGLVLAAAFLGAPVEAAPVQTLKVSTSTPFRVLALNEEGVALPKSGLEREMALAKQGELKGDKAQCLKWSHRVALKAPSIAHWATLMELNCALMETPALKDLDPVLARVKKHPQWLLSSPFADKLRKSFVSALVAEAGLLGKSQRTKAWAVINEAFSYKEWLPQEQQADLYAVAGEISFVDQDLLAAKDYFSKSLRLKDSTQTRSRLDSILLAMNPKQDQEVTASEMDFQRTPPATKEEEALYQRMTAAVASKDYVSALEDGVNLLIKFPRGFRAEETQSQVAGLYLGMATGPEKNWSQIKSRILRDLKKVEGERLLKWANLSDARGCYQEAYELADAAAEKMEGQAAAGSAIYLAGRAAQASMESDLAVKKFRMITEQYTGAPYFFDSLFRLGLVYYKQKNFSEAVASFEKLLSSSGGEDFEYRALYWTWRSLQNLKMERAKNLQDLLIQKYPMTLYGMKALAEKTDHVIKLSEEKKTKVVAVMIHVLPDQMEAWNRVPLLLKGGWLSEAQAELNLLPEPQTAEEYLVYSRLFSVAHGYVNAIRLMNKAWELNPEYAYQKDFLAWIFPLNFQKEISSFASKRQLEPVWVRSLIRQESAFNPRAVSRSNALGLMQLLPATAQEVATDLNAKISALPQSLFQPELNVNLGSTYLKRMLNRYQGQLPFALAAYNAGPTRLDRWLKSSGTEIKDGDLWVEELPWSETSFYVKAILRNILIFQILDQGQLKVSPPIWQISAKAS